MSLKIKVLNCYVYPILTYGSESWTISPTMQRKIEASEMWFYRRMLRISWTQHISNNDVLCRAGTRRTILHTIRDRQARFFGHIMRKGQMENIVITGKLDGKRSRGRPRLTFTRSLSKWLNLTEAQMIRATTDRDRWKTMIANVRIG